jgi:3-isopropylmalate/(R)-2-methylmalate dehydratase large subunit
MEESDKILETSKVPSTGGDLPTGQAGLAEASVNPKTLFEKIWEKHLVKTIPDGPDVIYIDKHFIHEVTSPQAFAGIEKRGFKLFRPEKIVATADHNVPTIDQHLPIKDMLSRLQVDQLIENCKKHGVELYGLGHPYQGIVHVIGPELGITQPGMTIVCGDSHTSTHGAFGSIAFGIGTSEVEMVFASQCLLQTKPKVMRINIEGELNKGVVSKDIILYIISKISASGATGYFVEYAGSAMRALSMEARMTICNMSIEMGAKGGMIAPDEITFEYMKGRKFAPQGEEWDKKLNEWKQLHTDEGAVFDKEININAADIEPMITYGTNPGMGIGIKDHVPTAESFADEGERKNLIKGLEYMGLEQGKPLLGMPVQNVFIGSCTNSRIEDLRMVADIVKGKKKNANVKVMIVPGSQQVALQVIAEGLDKIFIEAGFEVRQAGCSACLGMNEDKIPAGEYCISTSNRNFEGRQGAGARTLLASPLTAAAAAITGVVTDVRQLMDAPEEVEAAHY